MKTIIRLGLALVAAIACALALAKFNMDVMSDARSVVVGACVAAMAAAALALPAPAGHANVSSRASLVKASAMAAGAATILLARAPLPFVPLGAIDLGYGRFGEHTLLNLPLAVMVAVVVFGLAPMTRTP